MGAKVSSEEFLRRVKALHPTLDFSKTEYQGSAKPITFLCPEHGEQTARANNVLLGRGCPVCGKKRAVDAGVAAMRESMTPEQRTDSARKASAARTAESFLKISESQKARWATDEAGKAAQSERGKRVAAAKWAGMTPEQRKEAMAAVRAAKHN